MTLEGYRRTINSIEKRGAFDGWVYGMEHYGFEIYHGGTFTVDQLPKDAQKRVIQLFEEAWTKTIENFSY